MYSNYIIKSKYSHLFRKPISTNIYLYSTGVDWRLKRKNIKFNSNSKQVINFHWCVIGISPFLSFTLAQMFMDSVNFVLIFFFAFLLFSSLLFIWSLHQHRKTHNLTLLCVLEVQAHTISPMNIHFRKEKWLYWNSNARTDHSKLICVLKWIE